MPCVVWYVNVDLSCKLFRSVLLNTTPFSAWTGISSENLSIICFPTVSTLKWYQWFCTLFPVDSIVSCIYGIGVLSDRTWLLAKNPVLWALFRPLMGIFILPVKHKVYVCVCCLVWQKKVTKSISQVLNSAISWQWCRLELCAAINDNNIKLRL